MRRPARLKRRNSLGSWEGAPPQTTAGDAIHAAGYPLQIHTVTTPDGYVMQMERIPRPGSALRASQNSLNSRHGTQKMKSTIRRIKL